MAPRWSAKTTEILITLVEPNNVLFDASHANYKDITLKNNIWATIAKKLSNKINGKKNSGKLDRQ